MRLDESRESQNVEDRRGFGGAGQGGGGMIRTGGLGLGGLLILLVVSYLFGVDPMQLISTDDGSPAGSTTAPAGPPPANDPVATFASKVLASTEDTWTAIFARSGQRYPPPTLVLFSDQVDSACGLSSSAVGPFYCPGDRKVYLDLTFFRELDQRFGAPGDFAQAYVIAHEVGHHVQNLAGALQGGGGNAQSVRQELQADCLAGVWGHAAASSDLLDTGDVEEGLNAAAAIGDDRLQRQSSGRVVPESFTHGSSAERVAAFKRGLDTGEPSACGIGR